VPITEVTAQDSAPCISCVDWHSWNKTLTQLIWSVFKLQQQQISNISRRSRKQEQEAQLMLTNPCDAFRGQSRLPNMEIVRYIILSMVSY